MQILRTKGIKSQCWGGYLECRAQTPYLPKLMFKYMPGTSTESLTYIAGYTLDISDMYSDMPIGMSADACIEYWEDL